MIPSLRLSRIPLLWAALRAYLEERGDAIFDLEQPTRFTRLF
jgi:hypothetical protein